MIPSTGRAFEHVVSLQVSLKTTSDWARINWHDLEVHVTKRTLEAAGGGYLRSDGGYVVKAGYDTRAVSLKAEVRAVVTGPKPRIVLSKGNVGTSRLVVRSGRKKLADIEHKASVAGDTNNRIPVPLDGKALARLPGAKMRHFPRLALAFYYAWYGTPAGPTGRWRHWNPSNKHHDSLNRPVGGWYDSLDPTVADRHCAQARQAGLDGLIVSWWTDAGRNKRVLDNLLPAARKHGIRLSIYIEDASSPKRLRAELKRLIKGPASSPVWLKADGKPVFFLYTRVLEQQTRKQLLSATVGLDAFIVGDTLDSERLGDFDALHAYYNARKTEEYRRKLAKLRRKTRLVSKRLVATIMPGYDDTVVRRPGFVRKRGKMAFMRRLFRAASGADWVLITSFNEWHEGTEIEPSIEHGDSYLRRAAIEIARWRAGP